MDFTAHPTYNLLDDIHTDLFPSASKGLYEGFTHGDLEQTGLLAATPDDYPRPELEALISELSDPFRAPMPPPYFGTDTTWDSADTLPATFNEANSLCGYPPPAPWLSEALPMSVADSPHIPPFAFGAGSSYSSPSGSSAGASSSTPSSAHPGSEIASLAASPSVATAGPSKPRGGPSSRKGTTRARRARSSAPYLVPQSFTSTLLGRVRTTSPRNKQVGFTSTTQREKHAGWFTCSHCDFLTRRKGDFERHVRTHFALSRGPEWVCCGVPEEDAPGHAGGSYEHGGRRMVGGCMKTFSRRDSFLRHLTTKVECLRPANP
ncbi:uncharacterized protein B0H18DRAFT_1026489 [Fomitopsis serialis]|uniref:uncharacterized protein n=1 Tax=Fomitopsis serialis TaxID=139415 RepID=UPI0020081DC4|nr:uncharacterized protein B0H18DRAFT_1026489 [Neoantrodia serialis]KAH9919858.1 hypothetical protein B0H18DRAFT_1026489 [Neoantrodia serialis]